MAKKINENCIVTPDRALATIREINDVIPYMDRLSVVLIDGWVVITGRDEFKKGEHVVYFEVDTVFPEEEWCKSFSDKFGRRLKTKKIFDVYSQGVVMKLSDCGIDNDTPLYTDVTKKLHIMKYEVPESKWCGTNMPDSNKPFPNWIKKTDEPRIENCYNNMNLKDSYVVTEKIDGMSMTVGIKSNKRSVFKRLVNCFTHAYPEFTCVVCSRNCDVSDTENVYTNAEKLFNITDVCKYLYKKYHANTSVVIQGELLTPELAMKHYGVNIKQPRFFAFNLYVDGVKGCMLDWCTRDTYRCYMTDAPEIECVPIIEQGYQPMMALENIKLWNEKQHSIFGCMHEGIVMRDYYGITSVKCINREYLAKEK